MKLNGDWFYDQLKDALKTLGLGWGDKGDLTIGVDSQTGLLTFQADRRMLQVPADEDIRNEVSPCKHDGYVTRLAYDAVKRECQAMAALLEDLNKIRPSQPGCGDFSREQRTWADLKNYMEQE